MQFQRRRPRGVTVISILGMIFGVLGGLFGAGLLLAGFGLSMISEYGAPNLPADAITVLSPFFYGLGAFTLGTSVVMFLAAFGLFNGERWGWHLALIFLAAYLGTSGMVDVARIFVYLPYVVGEAAILVLLIFYLTRPGVKAYFGNVKANLWLMMLIFLVVLVASNVLMSMTVSSLEQLSKSWLALRSNGPL